MESDLFALYVGSVIKSALTVLCKWDGQTERERPDLWTWYAESWKM